MTFGGLLLAYGILGSGIPTGPADDGPRHSVHRGHDVRPHRELSRWSSPLDQAKHGAGSGRSEWLLATAGAGSSSCAARPAVHAPDLIHEGFTLPSGNFPATFYVITSFHGGHVFTGVCYLLITAAGVFRGKHLENGANFVEITGLYWHFVDLVWILVFTLVYLIP